MTLQPVAAVPVDAELWWTVYLRGAIVGRPETYLTGLKFDRRVPNPRPDRLVVVRRDGGALSGVFDQPRVSLDVWAIKPQDATDIARLMLALAQLAPLANAGCTNISGVVGPNVVPDASGAERRLCSFEATHRAVIVT